MAHDFLLYLARKNPFAVSNLLPKGPLIKMLPEWKNEYKRILPAKSTGKGSKIKVRDSAVA
jgi:hypothetical protein